MKNLRCLYLENEKNEASRIKEWISTAWEALGRDIPIEIIVHHTLEEAQSALENQEPRFDLLLVDIEIDKKNLGLALIRVAARFPGLAIVTVSERGAQLEHQAITIGAHQCISKSILFQGHADVDDYIQTKLLEALEHVGLIPYATESIRVDYDTANLALSAVLEEIGIDNLKVIILKLLSRPCDKLVPHLISPGLSGAGVLRVDCFFSSDGEERHRLPHKLFLKYDRDLGRVSKEYANRARFEDIAEMLRVEYLPHSPNELHSKGWYVLAAKYRSDCLALTSWLVSLANNADSERAILGCLARLFFGERRLGDVYNQTRLLSEFGDKQTPVRPNLSIASILTLARRARALRAISELSGFAEQLGYRVFKPAILKDFIKSGRVVDLPGDAFIPGAYSCWNHGDLHGRNVLVQTDLGEPFLIDPGNIEMLHSGADLARLCIDLFAVSWARGYEAHRWENLQLWIEAMRTFLESPEDLLRKTKDENWSVGFALRYLRANRDKILGFESQGGFSEWQWRLLIAVELVRVAMRNSEISTPMRVCGLLCSELAIESARQCIPNSAVTA